MWKIATVAAVLLLAIVLTVGDPSCTWEDLEESGTPRSTPTPTPTPRPNIAVLTQEFIARQVWGGVAAVYYWEAILSGQVKNEGNAPAKDVWIQVIFYDSYGWECPGAYQIGDIDPGETSYYNVSCRMINQPVENYRIDLWY